MEMRHAFYWLVMITVPIVVALGVAEVYVRVSQPNIDLSLLTGRTAANDDPRWSWAHIDAFAAYVPAPGKYAEGKTVNSHGHISTPEISLQKDENAMRLLFLGGSSTAGTGKTLKDEDTWPWIVHDLVAAKQKKGSVDFINGAASGYTTFESYGRLWSRLRFFSPDVIVVYHAWNEMYHFDRVDALTQWRTIPNASWSFVRKIQTIEPLWVDYLVSTK